LVFFFPFGMLHQEKSGNPGRRTLVKADFTIEMSNQSGVRERSLFAAIGSTTG
jgi:hypothetical protein